ncbi:MAG: DUF4342 domain-containing protein [Burkholderiaceae bacterium]|nr:DUF4342 domain-containing protein [Burkholderiaceae bacterium]
MSEEQHRNGKTFQETIDVAGSKLIEEIKRLVREGNVRRIRLYSADKDFTLQVPLTIGAVAGGVLVIGAPWLAILGVIAAMVTKVKIEVEREVVPDAEIVADEPQV